MPTLTDKERNKKRNAIARTLRRKAAYNAERDLLLKLREYAETTNITKFEGESQKAFDTRLLSLYNKAVANGTS